MAAVPPSGPRRELADLPERSRQYLERRSREGIWVVDADFTTQFVSPAIATMLGYEPVEMIGRPVRDFVPPQRHARFASEAEGRRRGEQGVLEFSYLHRDGHEVHALVIVRPLMHPERGFCGAVATIADLSSIEAADRGEREQRERYQAIFDAEPNPVMVLDREDRLLELNEAARRMLGQPDLVGRTMIQDVTPEHLHAARAARDRVHAGEGVRLRMQVRTPDGLLRWVDSSMGPMRNATGEVDRIIVVARDVTAEVEAELELRQKFDMLENLLEHVPIMIAKFGPNGQPLYFSRELERKLGWTTEEAAKDMDAFFARIHPDPEERQEALALIGRADAKWYRLRQHTRSGGVVESLCLTRRLEDGSVLGIAEDIGERVKLEEQLLQSQRLDSIGRLAGGVAHDFNNLLTVILGYGEMLANTLGERHPGLPMLEEMRQSANRAGDLTSQLLAFARRQVIRPRRVDLDDLVRGAQTLMHRLLGEHIELSLDLGSHGRPVRVDVAQMEQVLLNLAINARDAMPDGGKLTIETARVELDEHYAAQHPDVEEGPHVVLVVSDTGQGMESDTLSRIFEPFFTTKSPGRGTGLGLATVYGIVRQSGGHIHVYSEPKAGTTFKVYLPEAHALDAEVAEPASEPSLELTGTERIWIVEDDDHVRGLTARILREAGYEVTELRHPAHAVETATRAVHPPELLLTDVIMPGMSGRDLAQRLQSRWPATRVLYVSGYTHNTIVHHGVLEAGVEFLGKPFDPPQLLKRVRQVIGAKVR